MYCNSGAFLIVSVLVLALGCTGNDSKVDLADMLPEAIQLPIEESDETVESESSPSDPPSEVTNEEGGPIGWFTGVLLDYDGTPIPMAEIEYRQRGSSVVWGGTTYEGGVLDVFPLQAGEYYIRASHVPDHARLLFVFRDLEVTIVEGDTLSMEIRLPETSYRFSEQTIHDTNGPVGWIRGALLDHNGQPIANKQIRYHQKGGHELWALNTNNDGSFAIDPLPPGEYVIWAANLSSPMGFPIGRQNIDVTVIEGETVELVISFEE